MKYIKKAVAGVITAPFLLVISPFFFLWASFVTIGWAFSQVLGDSKTWKTIADELNSADDCGW